MWGYFSYSCGSELIQTYLNSPREEYKKKWKIQRLFFWKSMTYSKLRPSLSLRLFYEPRSQHIANHSGSAKETVSLKIGENIEMLVCFIFMETQGRILIDIVIICYYLFFIFSWQVKMHHRYNAKDKEW